MQSTNDLVKIPDKNNTETSNELETLKREVINVLMRRMIWVNVEMRYLIFLMKEWENYKTELNSQLMKKKNVRDGLKTTSSATKNTKDFLKNLDKRVTETSNKVKALEK